MSTPSSSARGPGQGPGSQVLSSVIKFRCLFTYDLRRKSKRWRDGYLKYHAFNKRVMVYDEQGNYVGDHHWRSGEEVQDGDEFELDKGVLIEVGEHMSTTQTDLSNLFEKKRSSQTSPQSRNNHTSTHAPTPRLQASTPVTSTSTPLRSSVSSQPFRSLNDLLGIKKTPTGHGHGHLASPYEERHLPPPPPPPPQGISKPPELERAPKRQKVTTGKTNSTVQTEVVDLTEAENGFQPPSLETSRPSKDSVTRMPPPREKPAPAPPPAIKPTRPEPPAVNPIRPSPTEPTTARPPKVAVAAKNQRPERPEQNKQNSDPTASENVQFQKPANVPRIPIQKSRNKFMYSTVMQQQSSTAQSTKTTIEKPSQRASKPVKPQATQPQHTNREASVTNSEFLPSESTQFIFDEMSDSSGFENNLTRNQSNKENIPSRRSLDVPLRKSISDPSTLLDRPGLQTRPTLMRNAVSAVPEEPEAHEEGPWTSEALDLCDFWPPGRPKPV